MSKSLADLRASEHIGLPERTYQMCLAPRLTGEVQSLVSELADAELDAAAAANGDGPAKPKRMGDPPAVAKIKARLAEVQADMAEHTGTLTLRGTTEGLWRRWVDDHPAAEDNKRDMSVAYGICSADALVDGLDQYAVAWNGVPLNAGDWEFLRSNAAPGDLKEIARVVVAMHETTVDVPKLLTRSLGIRSAAND